MCGTPRNKEENTKSTKWKMDGGGADMVGEKTNVKVGMHVMRKCHVTIFLGGGRIA